MFLILGSGCTDKVEQNNSSQISSNNIDYGENRGQIGIVENGDNIQLDYTGKFENGTVFDTSIEEVAKNSDIYDINRTYEPLNFTVGSNQVIAGFNKGVLNMHQGEEKTFSVNATDAYGEKMNYTRVPRNVIEMSTNNTTPQIGMMFMTQMGPAWIVDVNDTDVMMNFNHPLAGNDLIFTVKILSIEKGKNT